MFDEHFGGIAWRLWPRVAAVLFGLRIIVCACDLNFWKRQKMTLLQLSILELLLTVTCGDSTSAIFVDVKD